MEHRWGKRVAVDIPIRLTSHPFAVRTGRLANLSVSGAFIEVDLELRLLTRIQVTIDLPLRSKHEGPALAAYIARKSKYGFGIEWCEFAPPAIAKLLRAVAVRPYVRIRRPAAAPVFAGRSFRPLLRHGS